MTGSPETSAPPPIRVEVVCPCRHCNHDAFCIQCDGKREVERTYPAVPGSRTEAMMRLGEASVIESQALDALRDAKDAARVDYGDFCPPEVIEAIDRLSNAWSKAREDRNVALAVSLEALEQRGGEQSPAAHSTTPTEQSAVRARRL